MLKAKIPLKQVVRAGTLELSADCTLGVLPVTEYLESSLPITEVQVALSDHNPLQALPSGAL